MGQRHKVGGAEALFVAAFTYALTGILVREVSPMWSDSGQVFARFALVLVFLSVYRLFKREKWSLTGAQVYLAGALGLLFSLMVLFFTVAIGKTTVANVLFVFYATNMISSFGLGTAFLKENITRSKIIALILAIAGLALYSGAIAGGNLGIIFSIFAGLCGGTINLISKKLAGAGRNSVLLVQYIACTLFAAAAALLSGDAVVRTASVHLALLTVFFALVIILGSYLTLYGFQNFDVNIGTVIMSTELVFAAIMAYFLFNEVPKAHELLGGVLIFAGSIVGSGIFDRTDPAMKTAQPD